MFFEKSLLTKQGCFWTKVDTGDESIYTNPSQIRGSKLAVFSNSRFFFCYFPPNSRSQTLKFAVFENFLRENLSEYHFVFNKYAQMGISNSVNQTKGLILIGRIWMIRASQAFSVMCTFIINSLKSCLIFVLLFLVLEGHSECKHVNTGYVLADPKRLKKWTLGFQKVPFAPFTT